MCLSVDVRENFLSRFRPSCIKCGLLAVRKKRLLQFSQLLFTPLCLNLPTLHILPNFPLWEDGGDLKSKTLGYSAPTRRPPFYHIQHTEHCCRCGMPQVLPGWAVLLSKKAFLSRVCCRCPRRHSQAFQEDKGKSQLAIWVSCLDGFGPACFPLVFVSVNGRDDNWERLSGNAELPNVSHCRN